jgi:hypothetical protein
LDAQREQAGGKPRKAHANHGEAKIDNIHLYQQRRIAYHLNIDAREPGQRAARGMRERHDQTPDQADGKRQYGQFHRDLGALDQRREQAGDEVRIERHVSIC